MFLPSVSFSNVAAIFCLFLLIGMSSLVPIARCRLPSVFEGSVERCWGDWSPDRPKKGKNRALRLFCGAINLSKNIVSMVSAG